ncbi:MAG: SlyX family protein, partial [Steroidobacteraceae bacterium]
LSPEEARVIGSLIEKQITTPDQYPLSLNAITNACNQKSNRDPVLALDDATVQRAIDALQKKHLVIERAGFGSRVGKYQQCFCNTAHGSLQFTPIETAIVCELLLRGPQTPGELRTRAARMAQIRDGAEIEAALQSLSQRATGPLVQRLPREPNRRDACYAQLFTGAVAVSDAQLPDEPAPALQSTQPGVPVPASSRLEEIEFKLAHLERGLQELSDVVARQQHDLERLAQRNLVLTQEIATLQGSGDETATRTEIPPHY